MKKFLAFLTLALAIGLLCAVAFADVTVETDIVVAVDDAGNEIGYFKVSDDGKTLETNVEAGMHYNYKGQDLIIAEVKPSDGDDLAIADHVRNQKARVWLYFEGTELPGSDKLQGKYYDIPWEHKWGKEGEATGKCHNRVVEVECTICGLIKTQPAEQQHVGPIIAVPVPGKEPTCTEDGEVKMICAACGEDMGPVGVAYATGHNWVWGCEGALVCGVDENGHATIFPTNDGTQDGRTVLFDYFYCTNCGKYTEADDTDEFVGKAVLASDETPNLYNSVEELFEAWEENADEEGFFGKCRPYGLFELADSKTRVFLAENYDGHDWVEGWHYYKPTCYSAGYRARWCQRCGTIVEEKFDELYEEWGCESEKDFANQLQWYLGDDYDAKYNNWYKASDPVWEKRDFICREVEKDGEVVVPEDFDLVCVNCKGAVPGHKIKSDKLEIGPSDLTLEHSFIKFKYTDANGEEATTDAYSVMHVYDYDHPLTYALKDNNGNVAQIVKGGKPCQGATYEIFACIYCAEDRAIKVTNTKADLGENPNLETLKAAECLDGEWQHALRIVKVLDQQDHKFGPWEKYDKEYTGKNHWARYCDWCGYAEYAVQETKPCDVHDIEVIDTATCTEDGVTYEKCKVEGCPYRTASKVSPAKGHQWDPDKENWEILVEATCTEDGSALQPCTRCDAVKKVVIAATGHDFSEKVERVEPTCTEEGMEEYYVCSICGEVDGIPQKLSKLPHEAIDAEILVEATCTSEGTQAQRCKNCNILMGEIVTPKADHDPVDVAAIEANCVTKGVSAGKVCSVCGEILEGCVEGDYDLDNHDPFERNVVKAPTCTEEGEGLLECKRCHKLWTGAIAKVDHEYGEFVVTKEPTPTEKGIKTKTCKNCDATITEEFDFVPTSDCAYIVDATFDGKMVKGTAEHDPWTKDAEGPVYARITFFLSDDTFIINIVEVKDGGIFAAYCDAPTEHVSVQIVAEADAYLPGTYTVYAAGPAKKI